MPPKKTDPKGHTSKPEDDLPNIHRIIIKLQTFCMDPLDSNLRSYFEASRAKDTILIDQAKIITYAEEKNMYVDISNWDPKKKQPEGVPTELTPEILSTAQHMMIEEYDMISRKHKKEVIDAANSNKEIPLHPLKAGSNRDSKGGKDKKKHGEDGPDLFEFNEKEYDHEYDSMYILYDFPSNEYEWSLVDDLANFNFGICKLYLKDNQSRLTDEDIEQVNAQEDIEKFEENLRKRLDEFMDKPAEDENNNLLKQEENLKSLSKAGYDFVEKIQRFKKNAKKDSPARAWNWYSVTFNEHDNPIYDSQENPDDVPWECYFREMFMLETNNFSCNLKKYEEWKFSIKKIPLIKPTQLIMTFDQADQVLEPEENSRPESKQSNHLKTNNSKIATKGAKDSHLNSKVGGLNIPGKVDISKKKIPSFKEIPDVSLLKDDTSKKEVKAPEKSTKIPFEAYNIQLSSLPIKATTEGAIQEALGDEVEYLKTGEINSKLPPKYENSDAFMNYLGDVMNHFTGDLLGDYFKKIYKNQVNDSNPTKNFFTTMDHSHTIKQNTNNQMLNNGDDLYQRENMLISGINLIGLNRHGMETQMSQNEQEHYQKMQQTIKNSCVDMDLQDYHRKNHIINLENMFNNKVGLINWDFSDRIYFEKFDQHAMRSNLLSILRQEPEMVFDYNKTDDVLYVGFYFKNPPGLVLNKRWENDKNIIPNFQTWLEDFLPNEKLMEGEYVDLTTDDVGEIYEKRKMLYPEDGSIIDVKKYYIKDQLRTRVLIYKNSWAIGIKEPQKKLEVKVSDFDWEYHQEKPTVEYDMSKDVSEKLENSIDEETQENQEKSKDEIHISADIQVKTAEKRDTQIIQPQISQEPQEEVQEEATKTPMNLDGLDLDYCESFVSLPDNAKLYFEMEYSIVDLEDIKAEKNCMHKTFDDHKIVRELRLSTTYKTKDGLLTKLLANGDVMQVREQFKEAIVSKLPEITGIYNPLKQNLVEESREFIGKGTVIKQYTNGTFNILYANGTTEVSKKGGYYMKTNFMGQRVLKNNKTGEISRNDNVKCTKRIDPSTGDIIYSREDNNVTIFCRDGRRICYFEDGTICESSKDRDEFIIQHEDFATVRIKYDLYRIRNPITIGVGSSYASKGAKNIFDRSYTGRVIETFFEDGTKILSYKEMREIENKNHTTSFKLYTVGIIYVKNGLVIKTEDSGEIVLLNSNDYSSEPKPTYEDLVSGNEGISTKQANQIKIVNFKKKCISQSRECGSNLSDTNNNNVNQTQIDNKYFINLFLPIEEKESGVYTMNCKQKWLRTIDKDGNSFEINSQGETRTFISVSFNLKQDRTKWDQTPRFRNEEFMDPVNHNLPKPKNWKDPILFIFNGDNTGQQLLTEKMLNDYWLQKKDSDSTMISVQENNTNSTGIMLLEEKNENKVVNMLNPDLPPTFMNRPVSKFPNTEPKEKTYITRVLRKYQHVDGKDRENIDQYNETYKNWSKEKAEDNKNIAIFERCQEEHDEEFDFQQKMLTLGHKNIVMYNSSNLAEVTNRRNVLVDEKTEKSLKSLGNFQSKLGGGGSKTKLGGLFGGN